MNSSTSPWAFQTNSDGCKLTTMIKTRYQQALAHTHRGLMYQSLLGRPYIPGILLRKLLIWHALGRQTFFQTGCEAVIYAARLAVTEHHGHVGCRPGQGLIKVDADVTAAG